MCRAEFLNYLRVREWQDLYRQLVRLAKPLGLHVPPSGRRTESEPDGIHRALLAGCCRRSGPRDDAPRRSALASSGRGGGRALETERRGRTRRPSSSARATPRVRGLPGLGAREEGRRPPS
jgi:ATP-dependent helicase HrpA